MLGREALLARGAPHDDYLLYRAVLAALAHDNNGLAPRAARILKREAPTSVGLGGGGTAARAAR